MNEAQDAPLENKRGKPPKFGKSFSFNTSLILPVVAILASCGVGGFVVYEKLIVKPKELKGISQYVEQSIQRATKQTPQEMKISEQQLANITATVKGKLESEVKSYVDGEVSLVRSGVLNDAKVWVDKQGFVKSNGYSLEPQTVVNTVLNRLRSSGELNKPNSNSKPEDVSALNSRMAGLEKDFYMLRKEVKDAKFSNPTKTSSPRRLKEFNIVTALKDNTLFVVDAPLKNGKDNSITLTVGEAFLSKYGRHTVKSVEFTNTGEPLLRISGNFFIDKIRQEFTDEELAEIRKKSQPKKVAKKTSSKSTQTKAVEQPKSSAARRKLELKGWTVISTKPETNEVVVYNPKTNMPMSLAKNKYVENIGNVRKLDMKTGEVQFERYFIRGFQ